MSCFPPTATEGSLLGSGWSNDTECSARLAHLYELFEVPFALLPPLYDSVPDSVHLPFGLPETAIEIVHAAEITGEPQLERLSGSCWVLAIPLFDEKGMSVGTAVTRLNAIPESGRSASRLGELLASGGEAARWAVLRWASTLAYPYPACDEACGSSLPTRFSPSLMSLIQQILAGTGQPLGPRLTVYLHGLLSELGFEALAWIPASLKEQPVVVGSAALRPRELRSVITSAVRQPATMEHCWFVSDVAELKQRGIHNLIIVAPPTRSHTGWLVGINADSLIGRELSTVIPMGIVSAAIHAVATGERMNRQFHSTVLGFMRALTAAIDAKDPYTRGHSERVARLSEILGRAYGLDPGRCSQLRVAGLLHDIGKIGIRDDVLRKAGPLTDEEWDHVKSHVEIGVAILKHVPTLKHLVPGVRSHHERWDGNGYPDGLAGEQIPLEGRIIAVADAFDAMCSDRAYRTRRSLDEVHRIFREGAGRQWDPAIIKVAISAWSELTMVHEATDRDTHARAIKEAVVEQACKLAEQSMVAESPQTVWVI